MTYFIFLAFIQAIILCQFLPEKQKYLTANDIISRHQPSQFLNEKYFEFIWDIVIYEALIGNGTFLFLIISYFILAAFSEEDEQEAVNALVRKLHFHFCSHGVFSCI